MQTYQRVTFQNVDSSEKKFQIREYYKYELAKMYQVSIERFNEYYINPVLNDLSQNGYKDKKTRKLTYAMVKIILDHFGLPDDFGF